MAMEVETQTQSQLGFPFWSPIRRRFRPDDPFFTAGNIQRELFAKQVPSSALSPVHNLNLRSLWFTLFLFIS